ncbi:TolC family protein [Chitinimonas sp.]|uniref:TolC family protein n=1 Tax=Chitinimonas sp. TaxID=1934313 RepID=UPI002F944B1F
MLKKTIAAVALLAGTSLPAAHAAAPDRLATLLESARRNAPRVQAAQAALDAAAANLRTAGAWANPEIGYTREDVGTPAPASTVELRQRIELGGKVGRREAIAEAELHKARLALQQAQNEFNASVYRAYYELGLSELRVEEAKASADLAQDFSRLLDKKLAAGRVPPVEAAKASLPAVLAVEERKSAESQHHIAVRRLELLLGQPWPETDHALPDTPPAPLPWTSLQARVQQSPALQQAEAEVAIQHAQLAAQQAQAWPDMVVAAGVKRTRNEATSSRQFGVTLEIPLFSRNGAKQASAAARLDQAKAERRSALAAAELALQAGHAELQSLSERVRLYQQVVIPTAEAAFRTAQQGFELGRYGFIDVLDAQRSLLASRAERTVLWQRYIEQQAELERVLGRIDTP